MDEPRLGWADRPLMARSLANPTRAALRAWVPVLCLKPNPLKRRLSGSEARTVSVTLIIRLTVRRDLTWIFVGSSLKFEVLALASVGIRALLRAATLGVTRA